jgi:hypothetical protein
MVDYAVISVDLIVETILCGVIVGLSRVVEFVERVFLLVCCILKFVCFRFEFVSLFFKSIKLIIERVNLRLDSIFNCAVEGFDAGCLTINLVIEARLD